jgi:predicted HTH transcriptional regulator
VIEKRKNEIRFENPGICRPDINEILDGLVSDPRNPTIFKMFAMIDIGERAGSGIFNLVTVWEQIGWNKPVLIENLEAERTTLLVPVEREDDSGSEGINSEGEGINLLLETIIQHSGRRVNFYSKKLQVPIKTIERWIKKLRDNGEIEFRGSKKSGGYWKTI